MVKKDQQNSNRAKQIGVYQFVYKTGKYVDKHESIRAAERETKTKGSDISACCNGKVKQAGGFIWVRIEDCK